MIIEICKLQFTKCFIRKMWSLFSIDTYMKVFLRLLSGVLGLKIPVIPLTRQALLFFVPTLQFFITFRKKKNIFIPTDPKIFQKIRKKS